MKVVFRTDASESIGSGHLMRCLTLASALRERGETCAFVCREHLGHHNDLVRSMGFELHVLPPPTLGIPESGALPHAGWLGCNWQRDATETIAAINAQQPDWLIVDHYALDVSWERAVRPFVKRIMVIDDIADRSHDTDMLLDQNLGRLESDYETLVPSACHLLIGTRYALLRPEFARLRHQSLARRSWPRLNHLLIAMGGVDAGNATGAVLDTLPATILPTDCRITIVLGSHAPWREVIREKAANCTWRCELRLDVADMASLLADCDLAIGAAGASAWERCCLGLPSILVVLAANQRGVADALMAAGSGYSIGTTEAIASYLPDALAKVADTRVLTRMSEAAADVCDGRGLERVLKSLCNSETLPLAAGCTVRHMTEKDLEQVLRWRNHPDIRCHMYTRHEIGAAEHRAWFEQGLGNPARHLLIAETSGQPVGFIQFKEVDVGRIVDWGFYAAPDAPKGSGRILATAALKYAFDVLGMHKVCGQAFESNERSLALHRTLGFVEERRLREQHFDGERYQAVVCFGLLATEWRLVNPGANHD